MEITEARCKGGFPIVGAKIHVDAGDHPGVIRAARDLQADIERVTGRRPEVSFEKAQAGAITIGTVGKSGLIDGKIQAARIAGQWETYIVQADADGLVIAGSDPRGTIFGIYDLCERIGVSPWHWWADVPVQKKAALWAGAGEIQEGPPSVKYRGIFLNDEYPDLTRWIFAKYGAAPEGAQAEKKDQVANYGQEFYTKIFELILRLRGNFIWPAMWNNAFNEDDPENPRLAAEYGVVMGTSHQEPMLRAQKEWDRKFGASLGHWDYGKHAEVLEKFWREGIQRNKDYESIITIGLRGADDTPMAEGGPEENMKMLEKIVEAQRKILEEETGLPASQIPQAWCLYKEVQDFYKAGMRVPDDVTLLWAEDNWGNVRRLPNVEERARSGGAGIYYHFDYHGGPRSYQWLNTSPIPKIWDQMSLAKTYGADRIWIVNVGHFKGYEVPLSFFMSLAWDTRRWTSGNLEEWTRGWAAKTFGETHAAEIAALITAYSRLNGRRKPELLAPDTYSLVNYGEAEKVVTEWWALAARAEALAAKIPEEARDAYFELVLLPVKASAQVNEMYAAAGKNALYARQGRASTAAMAARVRELFAADQALMRRFNTLAGGKWDHFMDQPHIGYKAWNDPPVDSLDAIPLVEAEAPDVEAMGVAVEGTEEAWPGSKTEAALPRVDCYNRQRRWIEVFARGKKSFAVRAAASAPWIRVSSSAFSVGGSAGDARLQVEVDWKKAPRGEAAGTVTITGASAKVTVRVEAFKAAEPSGEETRGFVEGEGYVAMEAEHFTRRTDGGECRWILIPGYGRTLSGMRAEGPVDAAPCSPGKGNAGLQARPAAPCLEYDMHMFSTGKATVTMTLSPTLNFMNGRPLRYAVSMDDEAPQAVTAVPADYSAQNGNRDWEQSVIEEARFCRTGCAILQSGRHTLKVWMVDPGIVIERIVVDMGGVRPSRLGPTESFHGDER